MERFWSKTKRNPKTGCLDWTAAIHTEGYGSFKLDGKRQLAHRVAWMFAHGPAPAELCVCHTCDNRLCVNPDHLFLGTKADNTADAIAKGRHSTTVNPLRGEHQPTAKLNEVAVRVIRYMAAKGVTASKLARVHGVGRTTIRRVVARQTWRHVQ